MTHMIRKQVYIHKRQQVLLKRLARRRGVSEAEFIRQAIDQQVQSAANRPLPPDPQATGDDNSIRVGAPQLGGGRRNLPVAAGRRL